MKVYVLNADLNGPLAAFGGDYEITGDFDGITSVHATLDGALAAFDEWLDKNGIDRDTAHHGETKTKDERFVGNDVDPDLLNGDVLCWGINVFEVNA